MTLYRNICCVLLVLVAAALGSSVRAGDTSGMTLAMVPAPLGGQVLAPDVVEPVLLCGNRWVTGDYVLPNNCKKACLNHGHSALACKVKLVPLCLSCWKKLQACANKPGSQKAKCISCSKQYAACMKPFLN
jgi:hypothetical protein